LQIDFAAKGAIAFALASLAVLQDTGDLILEDRGGSEFDINVVAVVGGDGVALNGRRCSAEVSVFSTDIDPAIAGATEDSVDATGNGEVGDDPGTLFSIGEGDGG
jgi:hypothetical protein